MGDVVVNQPSRTRFFPSIRCPEASGDGARMRPRRSTDAAALAITIVWVARSLHPF
jgi:hypothetical protein